MKRTAAIALVALAIVGVAIFVVTQSPKWSLLEYEATVQEVVIQPDGERRVIVERTTNLHGSPINSLGISTDTKLLAQNGSAIELDDLTVGSKVQVLTEDSFVEELPFYYPSVHEIRLM